MPRLTDDELAATLHETAKSIETARAKRNRLIIQARERGWAWRRIGEFAQMTAANARKAYNTNTGLGQPPARRR